MTVQRPARPPTYRQAQVAKLIAWGWGYKEIAKELRISFRTVRRHTEELAGLIPIGDEGQHPEQFTPYTRVMVWAYWEYRIKPTLQDAA